MAGRNDAVTSTGPQLVQYEDDDDNDDKLKSYSAHAASLRGSPEQDTPGSHSQLGNQSGMEEAENVVDGHSADGSVRGYQEGTGGGAPEHVYMETEVSQEMIAQQQPHIGADGADLASEAMRVFCSYDGVPAVHGHTEDTPGGAGNDYPEEDLQERVLEEAALDDRAHEEQLSGYIPEDAERDGEHSSFSSIQQLQLRAQILVYGDLIKGVLPDESLMSSAFSEGGEGTEQESERSPAGWNWEGPWQLAIEKEAERREAERLAEEEGLNNKGDVIMTEGEGLTTVAENLEPGTPSASPIRVAEATMPEAVGSADLPVADLIESAVDASVIGSGFGLNLDAVVDNIVASAVKSVEISVVRETTVETQVTRSPSLDPWLKPSSSPVPPVPSPIPWETVVQSADVGQAVTLNTTSATGAVVVDLPSPLTGNPEVPEEGSRKRKGRATERKTPTPKATASAPRRSRARNASTAKATTAATVPAGVAPSPLVQETSEAGVSPQGAAPANISTGKQVEPQVRSNLHADAQNWLEQAKASFEEAVSAANSAAEQVQLGKAVTTTPKLASAAAAVNAAAAVAKAAAEAAKVAYEAALQAAMVLSDSIDTSSGKIGIGNGQDKDGGLGGRRSAIAAAKEEARKRATGATPSTKTTPQTTDAVLRAARLMADAASQAGAVLAKGHSTVSLTAPLSPVSKLDLNKVERRGRPKKENAAAKSPEPSNTAETESLKNIKGSMKKGARRRGKELQELNASNKPVQKGNVQAKSSETRKQLEHGIASPSVEVPEILEQKNIIEGTSVEVMNEEVGLRGGWFSAKVLQVRPGEAYVQYDEILTDDGTTQLKEWFPLDGSTEGIVTERPRIRLISPHNIAVDEGRRKRRRTTTWQKDVALGDHVDAFVQDGWWEGVVKSIDEDDESKITLYFPGEGDKSTVKAWNLRPTLLWKDGRWEQWIRSSSGHTKPDEGHQLKKQKVAGSPKVQARKSGRAKSNPVEKVSDEATENARASRKGRTTDTQTGNPVSPPITTRSSPRQKLPPKRKEVPTEVSTPTQAPTPVSVRTRSLAPDAIAPVEEPLKVTIPSRTKSDRSSDKNSESQSKDLVLPRKSLRSSEAVPSQEKKNPARRQAKDVAKPATRRSARL